MLVMKFKGAVLQNQETLAEIKNRIKEQNCCSIVVVLVPASVDRIASVGKKSGCALRPAFYPLGSSYKGSDNAVVTGKKSHQTVIFSRLLLPYYQSFRPKLHPCSPVLKYACIEDSRKSFRSMRIYPMRQDP